MTYVRSLISAAAAALAFASFPVHADEQVTVLVKVFPSAGREGELQA